MSTTPTVAEVLAVLRSRRGEKLPTYYIKNVLREKYKGLKTPWVLRLMKALERAGYVKRDGESSNSICWMICQ